MIKSYFVLQAVSLCRETAFLFLLETYMVALIKFKRKENKLMIFIYGATAGRTAKLLCFSHVPCALCPAPVHDHHSWSKLINQLVAILNIQEGDITCLMK